MKTLTLLRHAKSDQGMPGQRDYERALNTKGQRAAQAMGRHWRGLGVGFDAMIASPATRVIETIEQFERSFGPLPEPHWDKRAYLASAVGLLELIHEADDAHDRLLIVGHNSGMEDLVLMLVPDRVEDRLRDGIEEKFPTASVAELSFDVPRWADVDEGGGGAGTVRAAARPGPRVRAGSGLVASFIVGPDAIRASASSRRRQFMWMID